MKKKFSCMLLAFVMMLAAVPLLELPAFAEESVNLQTEVVKGDGQVTVTVSADGELDADALSFEIQYDGSAFELLEPVGVCTICKYDFGETTTISGGKVYRASPYKCSWTNLEKATDDEGNPVVENGFEVKKPHQGDLFKLVFNIRSDAEAGTYSFTPVDAECTVLEITTSNGKATSEDKDVAVNINNGQPINVTLDESDIPSGVTVSGTAVSWNNTDDAVYRLYADSVTDADIKADIKLTSPTKALDYDVTKGAIAQNSTNAKQYDQQYSFTGVPAGEYKLAVYKPGGYVARIESITVAESDIEKNVQLGLLGDVNMDGLVNIKDVTRLRQYIKTPGKYALSEVGEEVADVNNDNTVNIKDVTRLRQHIKTPSKYPLN